MKLLFIALQYLLPQHLLSRLVGLLADCEISWLRDPLVQKFIEHFGVDMSEAAEPDPRRYASFNAFFTRALRAGARPITAGPNDIAMPADGAISQIGAIQGQRIFQAKGHDYSLLELLAGDRALADEFAGGQFATIYLSPRDYHRVHMPLSGTLRSMSYVPGDLFSVNTTTAENVPRLFARNERAVCIFDTEAGPMAVILVGALIVAGIETVWEGQVAPLKRRVRTTTYGETRTFALAKGEEMGRFKLGSTAIVLFGPGQVRWNESLDAGTPTRMGETLGTLLSTTANV